MIGINNSVLSKIESDKRTLESKLLVEFADLLQVSADYLIGRELIREASAPFRYAQTDDAKSDFVALPIYARIGIDASGMAYFENYKGQYMAALSELKHPKQRYFYFIISENEMIDTEEKTPLRMHFKLGDQVLICQQEQVASGDLALVAEIGTSEQSSAKSAVLRRIFYQDDQIILVPCSTGLPPTSVPSKSLRILGKVVQAIIRL